MKKGLLLLILLLSAATYSKNIPGPLWYNISQKIISGSHRLLSPDKINFSKTAVKQKAKGEKKLKVSSKHQVKKEIILPDYFAPPVTKSVWFLPE